MLRAIQQFCRDDRGMSFVMVGIALMAFMAATSLAIDVGMMMTARSQAQNAADAGALSGATALAFNDFDDRTPDGPAVQSAVSAARANVIMFATGDDVIETVGPSDVTFPESPEPSTARVQVDVHRTSETGNPIPTFIATLFGVPWVSIGATATAEVAPANAMTCVKPFMIPDKWDERSAPPNDRFNLGRDVYIPANQPGYTGYTAERDVGTILRLRAGTGEEINPSFYMSWKMPDDIGGNYYRENIENCNTSLITWGDFIIQEPGNKVGPTVQGIEALYNRDPEAYWDDDCNCVRNSAYTGQSPRVFPIPLYDPQYYAEGKANGRPADFRVANFLGFFVERPDGNTIWGHITTVVGIVNAGAGPAPAGAFPVAIRLIR